ncbi:SigE family RNA polymerase sigma factor [Dactylosporangium matsuzakiense]|uniref:DNA-directed RNA polymerase sigma-70 factor n=1 Tax=Dactylosporangium matsuzakiense TaxID=53360 RepID=A0A9W6NPH1_9ACTN|nr:SigE family RNA polymerase sigma factor [Dactylosporangium matsuzakiense]UWZ41873.1 SigE family RNA polymerase sigma factor [Dactylosporangium matsuzakiense]GLL04469.1 DNA-directed RNA polymerase sigma-70 factor [Dactylosporangium matsuzakiense]
MRRSTESVSDWDSRDRDGQFQAFMGTATQRLYRVAYLLSGDAGEAEELTQSALVRTYTAWERVDGGDAYAYARRILVNLHSDWWRRLRRRERPVPQVPERTAAGRDPADTALERVGLAKALRALSRRERAVVVLRFYLDLTEQQTAAELGIALGTVKSATARALGKLRVNPDLSPLAEQKGAR